MNCIPITDGRRSGAMQAVERSVTRADVIELRMDLIHSAGLAELVERARACNPACAILVTHRRGKKADPAGERRRIGVLQEAVGLGVDYVDVELETDPELREDLRRTIRSWQSGIKLMISHHDFQRTPPLRTLKTLVRQCVEAGADVVKVVAWAVCVEDNLRVLRLLAETEGNEKPLIAFCMGPEGRISRIAAPMLGSCLSYVSLRKGRESASGQLTLSEMNRIMNLLRPRS